MVVGIEINRDIPHVLVPQTAPLPGKDLSRPGLWFVWLAVPFSICEALLLPSSCVISHVSSDVPSSGNPPPQPGLLLHLPSPLACTASSLRGHAVPHGWPCVGPWGGVEPVLLLGTY